VSQGLTLYAERSVAAVNKIMVHSSKRGKRETWIIMKWKFLLTLLVVSLFSDLAFAQTKGDPKAGKVKYDANCIGCHGATGKGDGAAAAALNPKPQDHTDGKAMNALTDKYLFDIIKQGGKAMQKAPIMPAANKTLTDQDISDMVAYIRSLANPPYKPAK
jgi:mono/diheme cytochrome c family protein